jgi:ABC-2 type transport system permease protein
MAESTKTAGRQRSSEQVASIISALLAALIVLLLNYLAFRHYERLDWTSQGMFTLSDKSRKVLRALKQDVDLYVFLSQGEESFPATDELVKRYQAASTHIKAHFVDPNRQPEEFALLQQRFGIFPAETETGEAVADVAAVVVLGSKNWHVDRDDLMAYEMGGEDGQTAEVNVKAEQALTGAIVQVTSGRPTKVCLTTGHGEWTLEERDEHSLAAFKFGLRHDNIVWEAFETLGKKEVPKGCDAVMVIGPERAFSETEAKLLIDYVHAGGNALLAIGPVLERDELLPSGFEQALAGVGVRLDRSLAVELDPAHQASSTPVKFLVTEFGDHATTALLKDRGRVVVGPARSVSVTAPNERVSVLLRTSKEAFGLTDFARLGQPGSALTRGPTDIAGPLDLALALNLGADPASKKPGGRLIVVGDGDWLAPEALASQDILNSYLASAWTGWLTQRSTLIEVPAKKIKGGSILFSQEQLGDLLIRVAVLLPLAALFFGVVVWLNRRA